MRTTDYNLPIFEDTDIANLNEYTTQLAEALKGQIDRFGNPLTFRGIVNTINDLPEDAVAGDIYNVTSINKNYVYSGTDWLEYSDAIDNSCQEMISDEYDSTSIYAVGDYCIYNNTLYRCITAISTAENFNANKWEATDVTTEIIKSKETMYSTEERRIGTWLGSPLYRKVVIYSSQDTIGQKNATTDITIPHGISNISICSHVEAFDSTGTRMPSILGPEQVACGTVVRRITGENIEMRIINDTWGARTWYFVMEYTKSVNRNASLNQAEGEER